MASDGNIMSFLACNEMCDTDKEIIVILMSWLDNWNDKDCIAKKTMLLNTIMPSPTLFVLNYADKHSIFESESNYHPFFRTLTLSNLHNLILKISDCLLTSGSVIRCCMKKKQIRNKRKYRYGHDLLASIFHEGTGFQSSISNCTFFRYNKIIYLLTKFNVWDTHVFGKTLLPCNDKILNGVFKKGIVKKKMKATLQNAIELTKIAKKMYGDDFYKLYEELI